MLGQCTSGGPISRSGLSCLPWLMLSNCPILMVSIAGPSQRPVCKAQERTMMVHCAGVMPKQAAPLPHALQCAAADHACPAFCAAHQILCITFE